MWPWGYWREISGFGGSEFGKHADNCQTATGGENIEPETAIGGLRSGGLCLLQAVQVGCARLLEVGSTHRPFAERASPDRLGAGKGAVCHTNHRAL